MQINDDVPKVLKTYEEKVLLAEIKFCNKSAIVLPHYEALRYLSELNSKNKSTGLLSIEKKITSRSTLVFSYLVI